MKMMYVSQNPELAFRIIEGEAVILTPEDGMLHNLNPVGTRIFELADGRTRAEDIASAICDEFDGDEGVARRDTLNFIEDMAHKKILSLSDKPVACAEK